MKFAKKIKIENFKASNGWLQSFKKRYCIKLKTLSEESNFVDITVIHSFKDHCIDLVKNYADEDIFNCYEADLFYRATRKRSLVYNQDKNTHGYKANKERITILFAVNKKEGKLKILAIGKAAKDRKRVGEGKGFVGGCGWRGGRLRVKA